MKKQEKNVKKPKTNSLSRRTFLRGSLAAGVALSSVPSLTGTTSRQNSKKGGGFKLRYGPSFGMFRQHAGTDLIDQIRFAADQGFRGFFDNGLMGRTIKQQEAIASEIDKLGMMLGPFVAYADFSKKSFVTRDQDVRDMLKKRMKEAVDVAKRTNCKWALVVPGRFDEGLEWDYQTANTVDNLRRLVPICEPSGLVMVLEPLNAWRNHPGLFLTKIPQTFAICQAVESPSCKIINDLYHQQITEGNLIPNIDMAWSEIASFHLGDNPGRKEPTTGEINYKNIFKHLYNKGYQGVLCMEHGRSIKGKEGEKAVIEAYRQCDAF